MTIEPYSSDPENARVYFRRMYALFERLKQDSEDISVLSMGTSGTWRVAVQEGANLVRIGTGIFGPRS
jgi:hypothetical protein